MKKPRELFKNKLHLLDEPEVEQLLDYCEQLHGELVDLKFEQKQNKQLIMLDMLKEVIKGCKAIEKEQREHERFGYDAPNYQETIANLSRYIYGICKDNQIYL